MGKALLLWEHHCSSPTGPKHRSTRQHQTMRQGQFQLLQLHPSRSQQLSYIKNNNNNKKEGQKKKKTRKKPNKPNPKPTKKHQTNPKACLPSPLSSSNPAQAMCSPWELHPWLLQALPQAPLPPRPMHRSKSLRRRCRERFQRLGT